ncbi:cation diffusion facilitator family transporter [Campylobacter sp. RM16188]|uniref:cation diffusion facilitator family transporter n=1 Tax=Campylobacter sp. RM16188 TaxID=1705725 RepID=UPI00155324FA|nr:cation diffusion facilitator family transporter [Campylobacter sp. RM16188]
MNCTYKDYMHHEPIERHSFGHGDHSHGHSHNHSHKTTNKKALKLGIIITAVAMAVQFIYSILTNSLALLSDTLHMFSHVFALSLSYFAIWLSEQEGAKERTFGFHRAEILAAFVNSITTAIFVVFILYEAIYKLIRPEPIDAKTLIVIAVLGLLVNAITGYILLKADMENINIKSSFLHMMSDLLSSVGVVIGGIIVYFTGAYWIDSLLALVIAFMIAKWSYSLIKASLNILLETSPVKIDEVKNLIESHKKVLQAHDIHIVEITHNMYVLTSHIVISSDDALKFGRISNELSCELLHEFNIGHSTFQPEYSDTVWKKLKNTNGSKIFG